MKEMCGDDPQEGVQMQNEPEKENEPELAEKAGAKNMDESEQKEPSMGYLELAEADKLADDPGEPQEGYQIQDEPKKQNRTRTCSTSHTTL